MKTKIVILTMILAFASLYAADISYSAMNDKSDEFSENQSGVFSPGYINAAKQKTDAIINQKDVKKGFFGNMVEYIKNKISGKVAEDAADKVQPELKKKSSGTGETPKTTASIAKNVIDSIPVALKIDSGESKVYENGRLISEVIDGKRYVYAGFDSIGKANIQDAINIANVGDTVIVKAGTYGPTLDIKNGVSLYSGYTEDGRRDTVNTPSIINDIEATGISETTEINGFVIKGAGYIDNSTNLTISNNIFNNSGYFNFDASLYVKDSNHITGEAAILIKNNLFQNPGVGIDIDNSCVKSENNDFDFCYSHIPGVTSLSPDVWTGMKAYDSSQVYSANDYFAEGINNIKYTVPIWDGYDPRVDGDLSDETSHGNFSSVRDTPNIQTTAAPVHTLPTTEAINSVTNTPAYYTNPYDQYDSTSTYFSLTTTSGKEAEAGAVTSIFKGLLKENTFSKEGSINPAEIEHIVTTALNESALSIPVADIKDAQSPEMEAALSLANIMKNPTEDQKLMIDAAQALMLEADKSENKGLQKASDQLMQVVAAILMAQAVPDLFKEGDIANIKSIFTELNTQKNRIILEYEGSTKPYYEEMVKEILKNMAILQMKNVLSNSITKDELAKIPHNELDKILEKLRQAKDKSFEEEYILQQEEKYRKLYIDPNKKMLDDNMKRMLEGFTKKLSGVLEGVKSEKR